MLDWASLGYGDFVYDLARIDFFSDNDAVTEFLCRRYATTPGYADRLRCYECLIGLDGLRFYAAANQRPAYDWTKRRLAACLAG